MVSYFCNKRSGVVLDGAVRVNGLFSIDWYLASNLQLVDTAVSICLIRREII
jgi:hypothetical protein